MLDINQFLIKLFIACLLTYAKGTTYICNTHIIKFMKIGRPVNLTNWADDISPDFHKPSKT